MTSNDMPNETAREMPSEYVAYRQAISLNFLLFPKNEGPVIVMVRDATDAE